MYLEVIILQDLNTNAWKISPKGAFRRWFAQRNSRNAHQLTSSRWSTTQGVTQDQPIARHAKAVVRGLVRGRPTPRGERPPTSAPQPPLALAVACGHAKAVEARDRPRIASSTTSTPCINRGVPPSTTHTTLSNTSHTSLSSCKLYFLLVV